MTLEHVFLETEEQGCPAVACRGRRWRPAWVSATQLA